MIAVHDFATYWVSGHFIWDLTLNWAHVIRILLLLHRGRTQFMDRIHFYVFDYVSISVRHASMSTWKCKILKIRANFIPPLHQRYVHAVLAASKKNGHDAVGTATAYWELLLTWHSLHDLRRPIFRYVDFAHVQSPRSGSAVWTVRSNDAVRTFLGPTNSSIDVA